MRNLIDELAEQSFFIQRNDLNISFIGVDENNEVHVVSEYDTPSDFEAYVFDLIKNHNITNQVGQRPATN